MKYLDSYRSKSIKWRVGSQLPLGRYISTSWIYSTYLKFLPAILQEIDYGV
jgi:hypothetical protein